MNLRTKIIIATAIILLLSVGFSTTVALNLQSKRLVASKIKDMEVLSNIIMRSIENSMERGDTEEVQSSLENIGRHVEILVLRILSDDGYILKSRDPDEIGHKSRDFSLIKTVDNGFSPQVEEGVIVNMTPVPNRASCHGCHDGTRKTNGIIEIKYDISRSKADIVAIKRFLILSNILTVLILVCILGYMFTKLIMTPLRGFMDTIKAVEAGNWDARVKSTGADELGLIGNAFNRMLEEVKTLYSRGLKKEKEISKVKAELEHKTMLEDLNTQLNFKIKEVETANKAVLNLSKEVKHKNNELEKMIERQKRITEVGRVLTSIIDSEELIKIIIKYTADLLNARNGSIYIQKNGSASLTFNYVRGGGVEKNSDDGFESSPHYAELFVEGRPLLENLDGGGRMASAIGMPMKMKAKVIGCMLLGDKMDGTGFTHDELDLLGTLSNQAMVAVENAWLYETVKSNYFGTIQSLVNALEASDRYTKGHSERVKTLGLELAKSIGFDYKELEVFEHAAILHDIGKIGIDSSVLNKEEKLTSTEFSLIKAHPIIGDEIMGPIGTLEGVRTTILQHHERYDGTGYPYGIAGDEITLKARILAVVDTFDAMLSDRPYRKARPLKQAIDELRRGAGTQFDPVVVNSFIDLIETRRELLSEAGYNLD